MLSRCLQVNDDHRVLMGDGVARKLVEVNEDEDEKEDEDDAGQTR